MRRSKFRSHVIWCAFSFWLHYIVILFRFLIVPTNGHIVGCCRLCPTQFMTVTNSRARTKAINENKQRKTEKWKNVLTDFSIDGTKLKSVRTFFIVCLNSLFFLSQLFYWLEPQCCFFFFTPVGKLICRFRAIGKFRFETTRKWKLNKANNVLWTCIRLFNCFLCSLIDVWH